jgi:hypothetical protein
VEGWSAAARCCTCTQETTPFDEYANVRRMFNSQEKWCTAQHVSRHSEVCVKFWPVRTHTDVRPCTERTKSSEYCWQRGAERPTICSAIRKNPIGTNLKHICQVQTSYDSAAAVILVKSLEHVNFSSLGAASQKASRNECMPARS